MLVLSMKLIENKAKLNYRVLNEFGDKNKIRFPDSAAIGIKPVSKEGSQRLFVRAIEYRN